MKRRTFIAAASSALALSTAGIRPATAIADEGQQWVLTFNTANAAFAGFDGKVTVAFPGGYEFVLPDTSFSRGKSYSYGFKANAGVARTLQVVGDFNWLFDHWTIDNIVAWNDTTYTHYLFANVGDIPLRGWDSIDSLNASITQYDGPGGNKATLHVWTYRGSKSAWGHAALTLPDGTHISWWPANTDRRTFPITGDTFSAVGFPNPDLQTDEIDESDDGETPMPPDTQITLSNLNFEAIKTWWSAFKSVPGRRWVALGQNCAKTVMDALQQGGAFQELTSREREIYLDDPSVFTPSDVLAVVEVIKTRGH